MCPTASRAVSYTHLVIVDTLQKVREAVSDSYSYSSDYEVIGKLKQFADRYGVCVLLVHHTRKQPAGDSFEMISGTTGLLGCAEMCIRDSILIIDWVAHRNIFLKLSIYLLTVNMCFGNIDEYAAPFF